MHVSYTPEWQTPDTFRHLLGADGIVDWRGSDYTIGFVRGRARGGEWGLALIDANQSSSVNWASVPAPCAYTRLSPTLPKQRLSSPASAATSAALNTFRLATFSAVSRRFASSDTRLSIP